MSIRFNADEIFEIALQMERNGGAFYRRAADIVKDAKGRDLLMGLARWEDEHENVFAAMRAQLSGPDLEPTVFDPEGESALYLRSLANSKVFDVRGNPAAKLTGSETYGEILGNALEREKDAVVFYLGMKEMVPERLGKSKIDGIVKEEMSHLRILSDELSALRQ